ncbi:hypothetical protein ASA1KI_07860 [Opitutales bacterium ASA1]|uniref:response regulator n=1 Tax=Congregicoccus parvus TaxID=3081749 RepID=UPI002B2C3D66|nr:hypothetical protein ASA1KI_07860 [Opitutales bacterium ASA1]
MDDDADLCMVSKGMLELLGFEADTALDSDSALDLFRLHLDSGKPYIAVILDLTMSQGLGGIDVLREMRQIDPAVRAIVSSGYATADDTSLYRGMGFTAILAKPYRSSDISRALREIVAHPGA